MTTATALTPVRAKPDESAEQVTQLLPGERVEVREEQGEWSLVIAPDQPTSQDDAGYPGWVRTADLADDFRPTGDALLAEARRHLGTTYVWGGMTIGGIDCSGLVHVSARVLGVRVPRDAKDQQAALTPVELDEVQPGDLYFFAAPDGRVDHVAFATGPVDTDGNRPMIHADGEKMIVVEEPMSPSRRERLISAARI